MKHLLNDLSNEEKNRIREQHEGGMRIDTSRFKSLLETTVGNVKPLIMEQVPRSLPTPTTDASSGLIVTDLKIDCTKRVITNNNYPLTKEMNATVIGAFCDLKNRNASKNKSDAPPPTP